MGDRKVESRESKVETEEEDCPKTFRARTGCLGNEQAESRALAGFFGRLALFLARKIIFFARFAPVVAAEALSAATIALMFVTEAPLAANIALMFVKKTPLAANIALMFVKEVPLRTRDRCNSAEVVGQASRLSSEPCEFPCVSA